jgi:glycine reductase
MTSPYRVIHCLNQFFGGLGGEEKANVSPRLLEGPKGPGIQVQKRCPEIEIVATIVFGDNYVAENTKTAVAEILGLLAPYFDVPKAEKPDLLLAGPAFNAGRYGIACGAVCKAAQERFGIPAVSAMYLENPGVAEYRKHVFIAKASENVLGMEEALNKMTALGLKLVRQELPVPEEDDYIPQGRRRNVFDTETGAKRGVDMLLKKLRGEPYETEYPMPVFEKVAPAPPVKDLRQVKLALVTSGGIVPRGNPDRIEAANAQRFGTYSLQGLQLLSAETHQTAHGGYDPTFANADPNRVLPLDVVRDLESEGAIGSLHETYYATVGNATSVANAMEFGRSIAQELLAAGVQAVILTST